MPDKKIPKLEKLSPQEARFKHAVHTSVLIKGLGKVDALKKKIIRKKGRIKPDIKR